MCWSRVFGALQIAAGVLPPHVAYWLLGKDEMLVASVHTGVLLLGGRLVNVLCWLWLLVALRIANLWHSYYHAWQSVRSPQKGTSLDETHGISEQTVLL